MIHSQSGIAPRIERIADVKDDEFEGDEQAKKAMKGMLPPLLDGMPIRHRMALETTVRVPIGEWNRLQKAAHLPGGGTVRPQPHS